MFSLNEEMYREIILDHVANPRNENKPRENYAHCKLKNPACGDEIELFALIADGQIKDLTYIAVGCSICKSSVSILSDLLIGKTITEANNFISEFNKMVIGEDFSEQVLQEAVCLKGVVNVPPRIKCATLGYKALAELIGGNTNE